MSFETEPTVNEQIGSIAEHAYHLDEVQLDELEAALFSDIKDQIGEEEKVVTVFVPWNSEYASFGRTYETIRFPGYDNHAAMVPYEKSSFFIYTVDVDEEKIAHVKRIVAPKSAEERETTGLTGIEVIDDRLQATDPDEYTDLSSILEAHDMQDIDRALNITSNLRTKRVKGTDFNEKPHILISYKAVFEMGKWIDTPNLFAYVNRLAKLSFGQMGLNYELLGGKEYHIPEPTKPGEYDDHYTAVAIPYSPENIGVFTEVNPDNPATLLIANRHVPIYCVN